MAHVEEWVMINGKIAYVRRFAKNTGRAVLVEPDIALIIHDKAISEDSGGYMIVSINGRLVKIARLTMGCSQGDGRIIDHINFDTWNNLRSNLRDSTPQESQMHRRSYSSNKTSDYKGVHLTKWGTWRMKISMNNGENIISHTYLEEIEAAIAYNRLAQEWFGKFAYLNVIPPGYTDIEPIPLTKKTKKMNRQYHNKTGIRGVVACGKKFRADYCKEYLGLYSTKEEAGRIRDLAAIRSGNPNVVLNFPRETYT